ncbi:MAG: SDR family oxidoreductase [Sediminicola sp.]|tara:strand:- start:29275 stop:29964 length:690 start_codon:yes stop_codon:yes gene_type:complete
MKNILLIGGSHGIGKAIAQKLSPTYKVLAACRSNEGLQDLDVVHIPFDSTVDSLDIGKLPELIHGFVYCPGSINLKPFKNLSVETFQSDMELNFFGLVKVLKAVLPKMADGSGLVLFSTVAASVGMPFHSSVAASKGALEGFAKAMAAEYAPKLRFNVIAPSLVDTPLASRLLGNERKRELMADRHPLKRIGQDVDIASMAVFLLGEDSQWITGQVFGVDGGISTLNIN